MQFTDAPIWHQAITWTNAVLLSIGLLGTNFSEMWIGIMSFSFKKMHLKMLSAKMAAILSRGRWVKEISMCMRSNTGQSSTCVPHLFHAILCYSVSSKFGHHSIFSCDQAALWMVFSVRLSVCPSVRLSVRLSVCLSVCPSVTPFWLCSHHRIIMKFSGVITLDQGKVHAKGQGQRPKVKVTEVTTQIFVSGL